MRQIPKNRIVENQYTNGTGIGKNLALRFVRSKIPYIGFYSIVNGSKYFSGRTYDEKTSRPLEKYSIIQAAAGAVAAAGSVVTQANSLLSDQSNITRYFYKDLTVKVIKIKEINQKAYNELTQKNDPSFQVISFNSQTQTLEDVNKQMPGLREFLAT
jgi:hypothetical protein